MHRTWEIKILADHVVFTANGQILRTFAFEPKNRAEVEELLAKVDAETLRAGLGMMFMNPRLVSFLTTR